MDLTSSNSSGLSCHGAEGVSSDVSSGKANAGLDIETLEEQVSRFNVSEMRERLKRSRRVHESSIEGIRLFTEERKEGILRQSSQEIEHRAVVGGLNEEIARLREERDELQSRLLAAVSLVSTQGELERALDVAKHAQDGWSRQVEILRLQNLGLKETNAALQAALLERDARAKDETSLRNERDVWQGRLLAAESLLVSTQTELGRACEAAKQAQEDGSRQVHVLRQENLGLKETNAVLQAALIERDVLAGADSEGMTTLRIDAETPQALLKRDQQSTTEDGNLTLIKQGVEEGQILMRETRRISGEGIQETDLASLKKALIEKNEMLDRLVDYIGGILGKIIENHPHLLEREEGGK